MDGRAWWATVRGVAMTEDLNKGNNGRPQRFLLWFAPPPPPLPPGT